MITRFSKKKIVFLVAALCMLTAICFVLLAGCDGIRDRSYKTDDYIEVEGLRIDTAQIYMAPEGEPSTYQINATTVPENATNKKMQYYIPTDYHQYVTVSDTGLLTAHNVCEEGMTVPVTVRSTTNPKATLLLSVVVESVAVERVFFTQDEVNLLYNGDPVQLSLIYEPAHAINGRTPYYTSLNDSIATVTSTGLVTPVSAGKTTIKVACPQSGESLENADGVKVQQFIHVTVAYAKGQYQLDVSGAPKFNQVVGDYTPIDFTLLILGDNVDPSPDISWYVDTERVPEVEDSTQYTHTPSATTELTYYVYAYVTPYQGNRVVLRSEPITIYRAFAGIDLTYGNLSTVYDAYRYGDEVTFSLGGGGSASTVAGYDWYMARAEDPANSLLVAHTTAANKDLTRRINVSGDYAFTVKAVDASGYTVSQNMFYFSAEKYVEGDVLIVKPVLASNGLPPDSYHYYIVPCDEAGNYNESDKTLYGDTAADETLYMPLTAGYFRLIVTASIGGVAATVSRGGEFVPYVYVGDVIRVYPADFVDEKRENDLVDADDASLATFAVHTYSSVETLFIEGLGRTNYQVYLKWNSVGESPAYLVEITKQDGSVTVLDSASNVARFGSNYCCVPRETVTLSDVFSVRVKQKSGLYSRRYYYGTPNERGTADATHTLKYDAGTQAFFATIGYNNTATQWTSANERIMSAPAINAYLSDMEELADLVNFVLLYRPAFNTYVKSTSSGKLIEQTYYDTYTVPILTGFAYTEELESRYPHGLTEEQANAYGDFADYAKMIYGAANAYGFGYDFVLEFAEADRGVKAIFALPSVGGSDLHWGSGINEYKNVDSLAFTLPDDEETDTTNLPIDLKDSVYVYDSEEMLNAILCGYRPVPQGSDSLANLYRVLRTVSVRVAGDVPRERDKLKAFYECLAGYVLPDPTAEDWMGRATDRHDLFLYGEMRLEGVFSGESVAADAGVAKAYAAMCGVYGIPCRVVSGSVRGKTHYFNKVYTEGAWYIVDAYQASYVVNGYLVVSGNYFLIGDEAYCAYFDTKTYTTEIYGGVPEATDANAYVRPEVGTDAKLQEVIAGVREYGRGVYGVEIDFLKMGYIATEYIEDALGAVNVRGVSVHETVAVTYSDNRITRVIVLVTVE